jgi:predicted  nucleic acid-binding Zn-ribbon protein
MTPQEHSTDIDTQSARLLAALEEKELEIERARAQIREFERRVGAGGGAQIQLADLTARERAHSDSIVALQNELDSLRAQAQETSDQVRQLNARLDALGTSTADAIHALGQEALSSGPSPDALQVRRNRQFVVAAGAIICLLILWLLERV